MFQIFNNHWKGGWGFTGNSTCDIAIFGSLVYSLLAMGDQISIVLLICCNLLSFAGIDRWQKCCRLISHHSRGHVLISGQSLLFPLGSLPLLGCRWQKTSAIPTTRRMAIEQSTCKYFVASSACV